METTSVWWLRAILMILSFIEIFNCLPVTSKPLDNTPEHLAWEAWIMVPQLHNKTRKITPKSIFILPNKIASPLINCPPGHIVENSKCIETVQIDSNAILLNHLANVLNNTNYDFDYDYNEFEESYSKLGEANEAFNDGPLKIDLLNPSSIENSSSRGENNYFNKSVENAELQTKPSNGVDIVSPTISTSALNTNTFEAYTHSAIINSTLGSAEFISKAATAESEVNGEQLSEPMNVLASTTVSTIKSMQRPAFVLSLSTVNQSSVLTSSNTTISNTIITPNVATPTVVAANDYIPFPNVISENDEKVLLPYKGDESAFHKADVTTTVDNDFIKNFLLLPGIQNKTAKETTCSQEDVNKGSGHYTIEKLQQQNFASISLDNEAKSASSINSSKIILTNSSDSMVLPQNIFIKTNVVGAAQIIDESEHIKGTVNDRTRFVYQYLDSNVSNLNPRIVKTKKPLVIINSSAENINKRAKEGVNMDNPQHIDLEKSFVPSSRSSVVKVIASTRPTPLFDDKTDLPITHQPAVVSTESSLNTVRNIPTVKSIARQNTRPFWWLPSSWEVEKNAENPILIRFWSRTAATSNSVTLAPYLSRENSRRPTENLFREISPREFYNVLDSKNKANNTSNFP